MASTPDSVGLFCVTTSEIICQIETSMETGKATREKYGKMYEILNSKYSALLN